MKYTWHIKDLEKYVKDKVSGLTSETKEGKVRLSRLYEALTGEFVQKDPDKGENFVIINKNTNNE